MNPARRMLKIRTGVWLIFYMSVNSILTNA